MLVHDAGLVQGLLHVEDGLLGRLEYGVQPAEDGHGQDDVAILTSHVEVAQDIISAQYDVFELAAREGDHYRDIATDDIVRSAVEIIPLSYTMKERIDYLREWARSRARMASDGQTAGDGADAERAGSLEL